MFQQIEDMKHSRNEDEALIKGNVRELRAKSESKGGALDNTRKRPVPG